MTSTAKFVKTKLEELEEQGLLTPSETAKYIASAGEIADDDSHLISNPKEGLKTMLRNIKSQQTKTLGSLSRDSVARLTHSVLMSYEQQEEAPPLPKLPHPEINMKWEAGGLLECRMLHDYWPLAELVAEDRQRPHLTALKGERLVMLQKSARFGWIIAELSGTKGLVPLNRVHVGKKTHRHRQRKQKSCASVGRNQGKRLIRHSSLTDVQSTTIDDFADRSNMDVEVAVVIPAANLHHAVINGNLDQVKLLLDKGEDTETANTAGETPLISAANARKYKIVRHLVFAKADVSAADMNGVTALHHCCRHGMFHTSVLLAQNGTDPRVEDANRVTPLKLCPTAKLERALRGAYKSWQRANRSSNGSIRMEESSQVARPTLRMQQDIQALVHGRVIGSVPVYVWGDHYAVATRVEFTKRTTAEDVIKEVLLKFHAIEHFKWFELVSADGSSMLAVPSFKSIANVTNDWPVGAKDCKLFIRAVYGAPRKIERDLLALVKNSPKPK